MTAVGSELARPRGAEAYLASESPSLTAHDVAKRFNVALATVYLWVKNKWLRRVKLGRMLRFYPSDVEKFERGGFSMPAQPRRAG